MIPGIGTHRYHGTFPYGSNYPSYGYFLTSADNLDLFIAAASPGAIVEQYFSWETDPTDTSISTVVPYATCLANGWLCHKFDASELATPGFPTSRVTLVGDPGYQAAYLANITASLAAHPGVTGAWIDIFQADLVGYAAGNGENGDYPNEYPTQALWEAAMLSFAAAVFPALIALGYTVTVNALKFLAGNSGSNTGATDNAWITSLAPYLTGINHEYWLQDHTSPDYLNSRPQSNSHATFNDNWDGWITLHPTCNALGLAFYGYVHCSIGPTGVQPLNPALAQWARANFLLGWNGTNGACLCRTFDKTIDPWSPVWTMDVGQPLAPRYQVGVAGGWRRDFTKGTAIVNPSATVTQTFRLGGTYQTADGTPVQSLTLAPTTAAVLTNVADSANPVAFVLDPDTGEVVQYDDGDLAVFTS